MTHNIKDSAYSVGKIFFYFVGFYALILTLWLQVGHFYDSALVHSVMALIDAIFPFNVTLLKSDAPAFDYMLAGKTLIDTLPFEFQGGLQVNVGNVTVNMPMTLSVVLALLVSRSRKKSDYWILLQVIFLLIALHFITTMVMPLNTLNSASQMDPRMHFYLQDQEYLLYNFDTLLNFLIAYAIRFEPFLMMVFTWFSLQKRHVG